MSATLKTKPPCGMKPLDPDSYPKRQPGTESPVSAATERWIALLGVLAICGVLYIGKALFLPVLLALLGWLMFSPLVRKAQVRGIPSPLSAALLVILTVGTLAGSAYVASGPLTEMLQDLPRVTQEVRSKLDRLQAPMEKVVEATQAVEEVSEGLSDGQATPVVVKGPGFLVLVATNMQRFGATVAITIILLFFMLSSGGHFHKRLIDSFERFRDKKTALRIAHGVEQDVSAYLATIVLINIGLGVVVSIALTLAGMPHPLSWGATAAILNFIPYLGPLMSVGLIALAAIIEFDALPTMLLMPGIMALCTGVEGQLLSPLILGRRFNINPVMILLAVAFWAWIWGLTGALIAVPVLVVFKSICDRTGWAPWFSRFVSGSEERPVSVAQPRQA